MSPKVILPHNSTAIRTATNMLFYFTRKGHKETIESQMRSMFIKRAQSKKHTVSLRVRRKRRIGFFFKYFYKVSTPFIGIKTRRKRRGNQVIAKLYPLTPYKSGRKSYIAFSKSMFTHGRVTKSFIKRFKAKVETFKSYKNKTQLDLHLATKKRHKMAFIAIPFK